MTDPADPFNLARFDDAEPITFDPQVWSANIAALRAEQPELATELERTALPPHWRAVYALDGFPTFRIEAPGQPAVWLAGTGAPLTRAEGLLAGFRPGDHNPSLPSIAAGAELQRLLASLPDYRAVYVFETEPVTLAAVLRLMNLATAIAKSRCIIVPPWQERAFLERHLAAYPGLLPPGNIVWLPEVPPDRLQEVRQVCEHVARTVASVRSQRLEKLTTAAAPTPSGTTAKPRLAALAFSPDRMSHVAIAALERAARDLGWPALRCALDGPRVVHVLQYAESLARFSPNLTICVNHPHTRIPLPLAGTVCEWVTDVAEVPEQLPNDDILRLAASPRVASALRAAAPARARIAEWYWACDPGPPPEASHGPLEDRPLGDQPLGDRPPAGRSAPILLVADWPDDSPEACGIEQPSHKQLWKLLQQTAAQRWETPGILQPDTLLAHAERSSGVRLGEAGLRRRLVGLVEHVLIPAAILRRIGQTLAAVPMKVQAVGQGWRRWPDKEIETLADYLFELPERGERPWPSAAVFAGSVDPLAPALLHAGALGWPLLIHSPGRRPLTAALGQILHPDQHFQPFAGSADLRAAIQSLHKDEQRVQRRAARTRQHLCDNHSYRHRLEELVKLIGLRPGTDGH